jgi:hypothetical protein
MGEKPIPRDARLVQVCLEYATFGLAIADGKVVAAAPIAIRQALGRPEAEVAAYYRRRGATFRDVAPVHA